MNKRIRFPSKSRAEDERVLDMIALRASGLSIKAVAEHVGVPLSNAAAATRNVLQDDLMFSGEPEGRVRKAYW